MEKFKNGTSKDFESLQTSAYYTIVIHTFWRLGRQKEEENRIKRLIDADNAAIMKDIASENIRCVGGGLL